MSTLFFGSVGFGEENLFSGLLNILVKFSAALGQFWWQTGMAFLVLCMFQSSYVFFSPFL